MITQDQLIWMIIRCFVKKSEHDKNELLYWVSKLCYEYGLHSGWSHISCFVYTLFFPKYNDIMNILYESRKDDETIYDTSFEIKDDDDFSILDISDNLIHFILTLYELDTDTSLYALVYYYLVNDWNNITLFIANNKSENIKLSFQNKSLSNCLYYASNLSRCDWYSHIETYFNITYPEDMRDDERWIMSFLTILNNVCDKDISCSTSSISKKYASKTDKDWCMTIKHLNKAVYDIQDDIKNIDSLPNWIPSYIF